MAHRINPSLRHLSQAYRPNPLATPDSQFYSNGVNISLVRFILALIITLPLLASNAQAGGKYDGEWHGSGTNTSCTQVAPPKVEVQFIVGADGIHGSYNDYPLTGHILGPHLKLKAITPHFQNNQITHFDGSLENGYLRMNLDIGGNTRNCAVIKLERIGAVLEDEGEAYEEYEDVGEFSEEVEARPLGEFFDRPPSEEETSNLKNIDLCYLSEIYSIPYIREELEKRYLNCEKLIKIYRERNPEPPVDNSEFEY